MRIALALAAREVSRSLSPEIMERKRPANEEGERGGPRPGAIQFSPSSRGMTGAMGPNFSKPFQGKSKLFPRISKLSPNLFLGGFQRN
jgi:hypothetical protein